MSNSTQSTISPHKRTMIFINIVISCIATTLLATALTTALPAIIHDLHVTVATGQWLTSGFSLAIGVTMPVTAFLVTRFSTKKLYLSGLGLFIIGLILCAFSTNFPLMMFARVLQGIGNGILTSMAQVMILSLYPPERRGSAMGWYGLAVSVAPVLAPTLAGVIVDVFNWRAIFTSAIVISGISFVWACFVFEDVLDTAISKFDIASFALSMVAFSGITLGIGNVGTYAFASLQVGGGLGIGVFALILFSYRQMHLAQPLLDLRVFASKNYSLSVIGSMLLYFVMMGSSIIMPLYAQSMLGYSATISGLITLPGSLVMAVISPYAGKLYDKIGIKSILVAGSVLLFFGNIGMGMITRQSPIWIPVLDNALRCAAIGCLLMPLVTWGAESIKADLTAHGTAIVNTLRTIAGAIGSAVFIGIMTKIAASSASTYKANADIHGLNVAFWIMSAIPVVLLILTLIFVKKPAADAEALPE